MFAEIRVFGFHLVLADQCSNSEEFIDIRAMRTDEADDEVEYCADIDDVSSYTESKPVELKACDPSRNQRLFRCLDDNTVRSYDLKKKY